MAKRSNEQEYRKRLGFHNKTDCKCFLGGKGDEIRINWDQLAFYNQRVKDICTALNNGLHPSVQSNNIQAVCETLTDIYEIVKSNDMFSKLNNQGRRPEKVLFDWMKGYVALELLLPIIAKLYEVDLSEIRKIGEDDFSNIDTFKRAATADLAIPGLSLRLEVQSGFQDKNDIKRSKIKEAHKQYLEKGTHTHIIHVDLLNGKLAVIDITNVDESSLKYHKAFENIDVFTIPKNWFLWDLIEPLPGLQDICIQL